MRRVRRCLNVFDVPLRDVGRLRRGGSGRQRPARIALRQFEDLGRHLIAWRSGQVWAPRPQKEIQGTHEVRGIHVIRMA